MTPRALRRMTVLAMTTAVAGACAAYAAAAPSPQASAASAAQTYTVSFAPDQPAKSSSLSLTLASAQQPTSVAVTLPTGSVLNTSAVRTCSSPPACDPSTQVGAGKATVVYSKYDIPLNFAIFNRPGGLALVISNPNGQPVTILATWSGNTLNLTYPNSYYKGVAIVVSKISLTFNKLGTGAKAFLRTAAACSPGGWASTSTFNYNDGSNAVVSAKAACSKAAPKHKKKK